MTTHRQIPRHTFLGSTREFDVYDCLDDASIMVIDRETGEAPVNNAPGFPRFWIHDGKLVDGDRATEPQPIVFEAEE